MRLAIILVAALAVGCHHKTSNSPTTPAKKASDLLSLSMTELEGFLRSKYRDDNLKLTSGANGKFKGTRPSPDGTVTLPIDVTVYPERVVCEIKTPAGITRDTIPLEGEMKSDLNLK